jgi:ribosomal-protein-serine acetyltransferase
MIAFGIDDELTVRTFNERDAQAVYDTVSKNYDHLKTFMSWSKPDYSLVDAEEFIARAIEDREQEKALGVGIFRGAELIGATGFSKFDTEAGSTEIGYWIDYREEGKGIMSRVTKELVERAFTEMKLNRVEIRCSSENTRSAAIPERLGFVKEGVLRQSQMVKGRLHDFIVYGMLASDWEPPNLD